jgi:integrase
MLKWPDVDAVASVIRVRRALSRTPHGTEITEVKTPSSRRQIPIGGEAIEALRAHRKAQTKERLRVGPRGRTTTS